MAVCSPISTPSPPQRPTFWMFPLDPAYVRWPPLKIQLCWFILPKESRRLRMRTWKGFSQAVDQSLWGWMGRWQSSWEMAFKARGFQSFDHAHISPSFFWGLDHLFLDDLLLLLLLLLLLVFRLKNTYRQTTVYIYMYIYIYTYIHISHHCFR